jgi:hypothetical protein
MGRHAKHAAAMRIWEIERANREKISLSNPRRDAIMREISNSPIYRQYEQHISRPHAENSEPWHAIGEKMHAAYMCAISAENEGVEVYGFKDNAPRGVIMLGMADRIMAATPFLWSDEIERLADSAPLPKHIISPTVLMMPLMLWSRQTCYVFKGGLVETNWMAIIGTPDGVTVVSDECEVEYPNGPAVKFGVNVWRIPYGTEWPTGYSDTEQDAVGRILKRCAFLASPYINPNPTKMARHHRRQLERAGEPREKIEETVNVVKLRHEAKKPVKAPTGEHIDIEWQHKWWVSGHYRSQWYPTEQAHKVIWIAPFLKGPTDKPLLEKTYTVIR